MMAVNRFLPIILSAALILMCESAFSQSGLEGRITQIIADLVRVLNVLIVGFVVWAGFLIAKGDSSGFTRLIYGVVGLIVVNASYLIIGYFN